MSTRRSLLFKQDTANPLLTDLVQYNPLVSNSNATIGVNGTDTNVTYGDYGDFQHSADFNTATSVINFGDNDNFSFGDGVTNTDFTISMRLKFDSLAGVIFLDKRDASNSEYLMRLRTGNVTINGRIITNGGGFDEGGMALFPSTNVWYWLIFYLDTSLNIVGVREYDLGIGGSTGITETLSNTSADLLLGKAYNNGTFNGSIGEFAIWRRILTTVDLDLIKDRYNNNLPLL